MCLCKIILCLFITGFIISCGHDDKEITEDSKIKGSKKLGTLSAEVIKNKSIKENKESFLLISKDFCNKSFPIVSALIPPELFEFGDKPKPSIRKINYFDYDFYFLMPISIKHDRYIVRGFSVNKKDKSTTSLYLYKSKSDGGWRSSLYDLTFEKGILYTQGTKIVPEVESILTKCIPVLDIKSDDPYVTNIQDSVKDVPFHDYFKLLDQRKKLQNIKIGSNANIAIEKNSPYANVLPLYEYYIPLSYSTEMRDIFFYEKTLHLKKLITAEQDIIRPCMPKNFDHQVVQYQINHTLLGEAIVFVYDGKCVLEEKIQKTVRWHIAYQLQNGKAWVHQVESVDDEKNLSPQATNIATFANVINVDLLALKPLDYDVQVRLDQESIDLAFDEHNLNFVPYDNNYIDITAITTRLSPVKEFLESVRVL